MKRYIVNPFPTKKELAANRENERLSRLGMLCECGSVRSAVTGTCVRGQYCPKEKDFVLDMPR